MLYTFHMVKITKHQNSHHKDYKLQKFFSLYININIQLYEQSTCRCYEHISAYTYLRVMRHIKKDLWNI